MITDRFLLWSLAGASADRVSNSLAVLVRSWKYTGVHRRIIAPNATDGEHYNNLHFESGNLLFMDGHVKWRREESLRTGEFGIAPDEAYQASTAQSNQCYGFTF